MEVTIFYFVKESSGTLFMFLLIQVIIFAQIVQKVVRYVLFYLHFIVCQKLFLKLDERKCNISEDIKS